MGNSMLLGLLAETSVHMGAGQSAGVVDLPVAREGATGLPHLPDTGLKGALRQWAKGVLSEADEKLLFGTTESDGGSGGAGLLMISTGRLLCLPIRRLDGPYAWVTTPYLLERLRRDVMRTGQGLAVPAPTVTGTDLLMAKPPQANVYLEEYCFTPKPFPAGMDALAAGLIRDNTVATRIAGQAAVMTDDEFAWFAANALPVDARNQLDANKLSKNLWYEETLPPDTLFHAIIGTRNDGHADAVGRFADALQKAAYLQVGGNESVGQGWLSVKIIGGAA